MNGSKKEPNESEKTALLVGKFLRILELPTATGWGVMAWLATQESHGNDKALLIGFASGILVLSATRICWWWIDKTYGKKWTT